MLPRVILTPVVNIVACVVAPLVTLIFHIKFVPCAVSVNVLVLKFFIYSIIPHCASLVKSGSVIAYAPLLS